MNIKQLKTLDKKTRLKIANHFFLATAALFVMHQNVFAPDAAQAQVPFVAQAMNAQPQTPPPAFDPDQMSIDEADLSIRPDERQYSPAIARSVIVVD